MIIEFTRKNIFNVSKQFKILLHNVLFKITNIMQQKIPQQSKNLQPIASSIFYTTEYCYRILLNYIHSKCVYDIALIQR